VFHLSGFPDLKQSDILLPAVLLVCVAGLASLPLPDAVPPVVPALAETLTAAVIIGGLGRGGLLFLPYLTVPLFVAGLTAGIAAGAACSALASATLIGTAAGSTSSSQEALRSNGSLVAWIFVFFAVPAVGAWIRRLRSESLPDSEPAYADAHRLLSELHVVARQLSLGLDPRTLSAALAEDIRAISPQSETAVLGRSPGGRFIALAGHEPSEEAEPAIEKVWESGTTARHAAGDHGGFTIVPVLMGENVVALVVITTPSAMDDDSLESCHSLIDQSGPRLASAMLFDDVRRLATTDERMRLAREIHDGIAQDLASVGYALDDIRRDCEPELGRQVMTVREQLQAMVADLRMSIFDLRSGIDDSTSLGTTLSEHAQRVGGQSGLVVHAVLDEAPGKRLPISVEVELMRIVQEAITNVRRHAQADNLWLSVTVEPPRALISVTDDGRGLGSGRIDSFGITGMRERAKRIGALLRVTSGPNDGTMVEVALGTDSSTRPQQLTPPVVTRSALTDPHGITLVPQPTARSGAVPRAEQEVSN
jgi:two-component sensor histidine kinase